MDIEFTPSDEAVRLAIRAQIGSNPNLRASRPEKAPASARAAEPVFYSTIFGLRSAFAETTAKAKAARVPDAVTLQRARGAIGSMLFRVVGTLSRRKPSKHVLTILKGGSFDPAVGKALVERLALAAPESEKFLEILAADVSKWADENAADLRRSGIVRAKGKLTFDLAAAKVAIGEASIVAEAAPAAHRQRQAEA